MSNLKFSVCMAVYYKDNPLYFKKALDSVVNQTLLPNQIVLVVDGPIGVKLNEVISNFKVEKIKFDVIRLKINCGHAIARQVSIENAEYDLVAIMDSDDVAVYDRFEKQIKYIRDYEVDVVGGQIMEFIGDEKNIVGFRKVPLEDYNVKMYLRKRCPFNQMTVMFNKPKVLSVGGYQDWFCNEDYYLWIRMFLAGCKFANLSDVLVNVRVGKDMYRRRGGLKYFKSEAKLQKYMLDNAVIGYGYYFYNVFVRFIVQVMMPNAIRGFIFQKLFRTK